MDAPQGVPQYRGAVPDETTDPESVFSKVKNGRHLAFFREHPLVADWLLITPLIVVAILTVVLDEPLQPKQRPWDVFGVFLVAVIILPVAYRRRAPLVVTAINIAGTVPLLILNYPDTSAGMASLIVMYTVAAHCKRRDALIALAWVAVIIIPVLVAGVFAYNEQLPIGSLIANIVIFGTAWLIGDSVRNRRILMEELKFRAETAERQREDDARQAVLDERARIAREMHDIVAHGMSVMIVQAGAARRVMEKHPDQAAEAMANIEQTGRDAMVEMRRLLGVLRDGGVEADLAADRAADRASTGAPGSSTPIRREAAPLAPQPGLQAVPALVEQWTTAGLEVGYQVVGELPELPTSLDVSVYRLIQEALTNTSKHAGPAHATVTVRAATGSLDITIEDDGYGAAAVPGPGTGHGLIGMKERVSLFGGSVTAGPGKSGGYVVHATVPLDACAPAPAVEASTP